MPHYNGKMGNSKFGKHTTYIEGLEVLVKAISKMPLKSRIKLGIIEKRKPAKPFINCTVTQTSLIFKVGITSIQTFTVTTQDITPLEFLEKFLPTFDQEIRVRSML
jgi:hypothetical protein